MSRVGPAALVLAITGMGATVPPAVASDAAVPRGGSAGNTASAIALGGPEVFKVDWDTRSLVAQDLNGDGRTDLAVLNNDRARIDLLLQRQPGEDEPPSRRSARTRWEPVLDDARFRRHAVVTGTTMYALAAGDLDGDGRVDLAYTGKPDGLTVVYQGRDGDWSRKRVFESEQANPWTASLAIADLDGDGRRELVLLGQDALVVFSRDERGELTARYRYRLAEKDCYGLLVHDVDGDRLPDLGYLAPKSAYPWRVRLQHSLGGFGPERTFRIQPPRRFLTPVRLAGGESTTLAGVQFRTGLIELISLEKSASNAGSRLSSLSPRIYSTPTQDNAAGSYAVGDVDGDGRPDVVVADRKGAQVWLYRQRSDGSFSEATAFPSFADLRSISLGDVDGDGSAELFVVSPRERALGLSRWSREGRLSYPRALPLAGRPVAVTAVNLDGDPALELACLVDRDGVRSVAVLDSTGNADEWREAQKAELSGLRTDPTDLKVVDANRDGRSDLAVFVPQGPMHLLLQAASGELRDSEAAFRRGLADLQPSALSSGDVDGDGRPELIVSGRGFARALQIAADGRLETLDQFNGPNPEAEIAAAVPLDVDQQGKPVIVLAEKGGQKLEVLRRDRNGVYRPEASVSVGAINVVDSRVLDLDGDGRDELLLLGDDRFWTVALGAAELAVRSRSTYETDLSGLVYVELAAGDLDGDGRDELVAVDSRQSHVLEVLAWDRDAIWRSVLHFTVFDADPHFEGRSGTTQEPRELLLADLTGDGRPDVALLVHDRILLYPTARR